MKNIKILIVMLAAATVLISVSQGERLAWAQSLGGAPKLFIEETVFKAGQAEAGSNVSHDFILKNNGTADLEIIQVIPGCGCTASNFDKVIAPGKTGKISITVALESGWGGETIDISTLVETNDPKASIVNLIISTDVIPGK